MFFSTLSRTRDMLSLLPSHYHLTIHIWDRAVAEEWEATRAKSGRFASALHSKKKCVIIAVTMNTFLA
jgi:hypothetical protein